MLNELEVDSIAREYISEMGYVEYYTHRLGHSLGLEVYGNAVNLDGRETQGTRKLIPCIGVTIWQVYIYQNSAGDLK